MTTADLIRAVADRHPTLAAADVAYAEAAKHDELYQIGYEPGSQGGIDHAIRDDFNHQARDLYKEAERLDALLLTGTSHVDEAT